MKQEPKRSKKRNKMVIYAYTYSNEGVIEGWTSISYKEVYRNFFVQRNHLWHHVFVEQCNNLAFTIDNAVHSSEIMYTVIHSSSLTATMKDELRSCCLQELRANNLECERIRCLSDVKMEREKKNAHLLIYLFQYDID